MTSIRYSSIIPNISPKVMQDLVVSTVALGDVLEPLPESSEICKGTKAVLGDLDPSSTARQTDVFFGPLGTDYITRLLLLIVQFRGVQLTKDYNCYYLHYYSYYVYFSRQSVDLEVVVFRL